MTRFRRSRRGAALSAALAVAVGVSAPPAAAATVTDAKYGFSFSLPAKWQQIPLTGAKTSALIKAATKAAPGLAKALGKQVASAVKAHINVFAVGPVTDGSLPNLNVGVYAAPGVRPGPRFVAAMASEVRKTFTQIGAHKLTIATVKPALGESVEATYVLPLESSTLHAADGLQVDTDHRGHVYVITFTAANLHLDRAAAHLVESTWRWAP